MKIKQTIKIQNKLLILKLLKLKIYKKKYKITANLKIIELQLKKLVQIIYKYKTVNKKLLLITNLLNIVNKIKNKFNILKFLKIYWINFISLIKKHNSFLNSRVALIITERLTNFLQINSFPKIPKIFLENYLYLASKLNIQIVKTIIFNKQKIIDNFILLLFHINNEFKKK